jgi:hypothetical protein
MAISNPIPAAAQVFLYKNGWGSFFAGRIGFLALIE